MELPIFHCDIFMVTPSHFTTGVLPLIPELLSPRWANCPGGGARRLTCNYLENVSPQAYEVGNKELDLVKTCKKYPKYVTVYAFVRLVT